jgi:hypothetical protein
MSCDLFWLRLISNGAKFWRVVICVSGHAHILEGKRKCLGTFTCSNFLVDCCLPTACRISCRALVAARFSHRLHRRLALENPRRWLMRFGDLQIWQADLCFCGSSGRKDPESWLAGSWWARVPCSQPSSYRLISAKCARRRARSSRKSPTTAISTCNAAFMHS